MTAFTWSMAGLAILAAGVLLWLRPWMDRGQKWRQRNVTRYLGDPHNCEVTDLEADQFTRIATRYPNLGKGVNR